MRCVMWAFCASYMLARVGSKFVQEELNLTWEIGAPNGRSRDMIKTNGQFPGPALIWDEDDDIEV